MAGPKVLVVDDDADVSLLCSLHLRQEGFEVVTAADGAEAIRLARQERPAVVVLDFMLPDLDGLSVLERLRADASTAEIPVVMLTARTEKHDQQAAWEAGVADYLTKPFEAGRLVAAVRAALHPDGDPELSTRRREALDRLRASDLAALEQQASIVDHADDAIVSTTSAGVIATWNRAATRVYGFERDEVVGQPISVLAPPDQPDTLLEQLHRAGRGEPVGQVDVARQRKDGTVVDVSVSLASMHDASGTVTGVATVHRDVSDRRRADDRFRSLVETAPDAIVIVDELGRIELVNAQTERLFGYERTELIGQPVEVLVPARYRTMHPVHRTGYVAHPKVRGMGAGLDLHGLRKDGSEFPVEISLSPLQTDTGMTVSAAIRDVTERKQADDARAHALRREQEASERLRQVDRLRSDFLSTVSHELRTPLTTITGFADMLVGDWGGFPDPQKQDLVQRISRSGARLNALIGDLLDFTRLEGGQLRFVVEEVEVVDAVADAVQRCGPILEDRRVHLDVPEDVLVLADPTALGRILDNLLGNAAKFSGPGATVSVRASASHTGAETAITVADEGIGIPADELANVFDRFYRVGGQSNRRPGTGIGLAIVKEFTEDLSGRVGVTSIEGEGTEFTVVFPAPTPAT
ncbi:MAG: hybrid sensor histidine kinase/response regulator [Acidimicrobiales bacterium]